MNNLLLSVAFVCLYSSGFVAAKIGLSYADSLSFLACRFLLTGVLLGILCFYIKAPTPPTFKDLLHSSVAGLFLIGLFSIGVFISISESTPEFHWYQV